MKSGIRGRAKHGLILAKERRQLVFREIFPAETSQLQRIRRHLLRLTRASRLAETDIEDLVLAVDEAIANIVLHAYTDASGGVVSVSVAQGRDDVMVVIEDSGIYFDFFGCQRVDPMSRFNSGQRGGLGIFLIRNLIDRIGYFRDGDRNRMVLVRGRREG